MVALTEDTPAAVDNMRPVVELLYRSTSTSMFPHQSQKRTASNDQSQLPRPRNTTKSSSSRHRPLQPSSNR